MELETQMTNTKIQSSQETQKESLTLEELLDDSGKKSMKKETRQDILLSKRRGQFAQAKNIFNPDLEKKEGEKVEENVEEQEDFEYLQKIGTRKRNRYI